MHLAVLMQPVDLVEQGWQFFHFYNNDKRHGSHAGCFLAKEFRMIEITAKHFSLQQIDPYSLGIDSLQPIH